MSIVNRGCELRQMLWRLFYVMLTEPEAVLAQFVSDGGMELDGSTFTFRFIQVWIA